MLKSLFFALSCALATQASPLNARQGPAVASEFRLYAYGEGLGGLRVFYADGQAQIGDIARSTAKEKSEVYFTVSKTNANSWIAHTSSSGTDAEFTTASANSTILSLPTDGGSDQNVVFRPNTATFAASQEAKVFTTYGEYVLIDWETANFFAEATDVEGVYSLLWNNAGSNNIPVALRTRAPSTEAIF
ncbi:hypothetical protein BDV18DRAFT_134300 [Aspergillus unguis]